jgi:hypothetical protein
MTMKEYIRRLCADCKSAAEPEEGEQVYGFDGQKLFCRCPFDDHLHLLSWDCDNYSRFTQK